MKTLHLKLTSLLFLVLIAFSVQAQSYGSWQLPAPDKLTPFFIGSISESNVYYGDVPTGSASKPVIVFVHGFIDLANLWFTPGNRMYDRAHHDGYRTAFVAMTRGGGMWTNGELLSRMLEDITDHYNVQDVVIVAHSNGGKASEVAMFEYNKSNLVDRVISLGTPFGGTELADLSQTWLFSWLVDLVDLGGGASTSTTYYMGGVARPYLDALPNNQPNKFLNYGGWGYLFGSNILSPTMVISGGVLAANGSGAWVGGNDGVTPFWSSTRPGGDPYFSWGFGNPYNAFDHIDVALSYVMYDRIRPNFTSTLPAPRLATTPTINHKKEVISNMQLVSSQGNYQDFTIEKNAQDVEFSLFFKDELAGFQLENVDVNGRTISSERLDVSEITEGFMGNSFSTNLRMNDLQAGHYRLTSDAVYAGAVHYKNGISLKYTSDLNDSKLSYETGETINLEIELLDAKKLSGSASVNAIVTKKTDLEGNAVQEEVLLVDFQRNGLSNTYSASIEGSLAEGTYNVLINATHKDFTKSLVTGFAVKKAVETETLVLDETLELSIAPNPVVGNVANVEFELLTETESHLQIVDLFGRVLTTKEVTDFGVGTHRVEIELEDNLSTGLYFVRLQNGRAQGVVNMIRVN